MEDLIPRKLIFGNPERMNVEISPDGAHLAWLAPREEVMNVWVAPRDRIEAAEPVTADTGRGIMIYTWAATSRHIVYLRDKEGDENWRIHVVDLDSQSVRDLTPWEGIQARIVKKSRHFPNELIIGLNDRDPQWHDLYRLDIESGEMKLICENNQFAGFVVDNRFRLREAYAITEDGGAAIHRPARSGDGSWTVAEEIPPEDTLTTNAVGFDEPGTTLYMIDSRGRDTAALYAVDPENNERRLLAEDARADVQALMMHPTTHEPQAVGFTRERTEWRILDSSIEEHLTKVREETRGEVDIANRSLDDRYWVIVEDRDIGPVTFHLYDSVEKKLDRLFTTRPYLENQPLVPMHSATIESRDGLDMVVYYSLPPGSDSDGDGIPEEPQAMVLVPHGGPWARDYWGYNPEHQWLANRGYAVLSVNFRSSTGFGKAFTNAGDRQWGEKIIEDQIDAVEWAKAHGIADGSLVGIMGGSFGGYSVLAGLTFHPDYYACGVDIVGPSNLQTLLESVPEYWKPELDLFRKRVGDERSEEGRALLEQHSPLTFVDRIRKPLLVAQGANDPRVKQAESDQIVKAMQSKGIPVTYVLYSNEGHGFDRPENRLSFYAISEAFLKRHLGGRAEPFGEDITGSSFQIGAGAEEVTGLQEALGRQGAVGRKNSA